MHASFHTGLTTNWGVIGADATPADIAGAPGTIAPMPLRPTSSTGPQDSAEPDSTSREWQRRLRISAWLLAVWAAATFGTTYFARQLDDVTRGWPFSFWMAAQGSLLVYLVLVVVYALRMERIDDDRAAPHVD